MSLLRRAPGFRLPSIYRLPDIVIVRDAPEGEEIVQPPLVVLEVLSPRDTQAETQRRSRDYRDMGVENLWIVDPGTRTRRACNGETASDHVTVCTHFAPASAHFLSGEPPGRERLAPMRILRVFSLALFSSCHGFAQGNGNKLADNKDAARMMIAKLDHAAQDDPPPNFASQILFATIKKRWGLSAWRIRLGIDASGQRLDATSMFMLCSQFIDLFDSFELHTTGETRPLA